MTTGTPLKFIYKMEKFIEATAQVSGEDYNETPCEKMFLCLAHIKYTINVIIETHTQTYMHTWVNLTS